MNRASQAAWKMIDEYFAAKRCPSPRATATKFMRRVLVKRRRWMSDIQRATADSILNDAHYSVDDLAENFLDLDLAIQPLHRFDETAGAPVYGLARPASKNIVICERATAYEPLYRATAMHEIGHVLMHGNPATRSLPYSPSSPRRPKHEREADDFMHESLLPMPILRLAISRIADCWDMDLREAVALADTAKGRWQWKNRYFPGMVNRLCVSRHLIALKMKHLGAFSHDTYRYHLSYALPNRWLRESRSEPLRRLVDETIGTILTARTKNTAG